ncbi:MAG: phosphoribosylglycinamide formyltransferase [Paracoccaceae bacterium]|nr:phosphoribosylglycinamide formyltransferase [Paracoccaceae bacterium]
MPAKIKVAILISGLGSNMEALIKDLKNQNHLGEATIVVSDNPDALGLMKAEQLKIPAFSFATNSKTLDKSIFENNLLQLLISNNIQVVCLAGFMKILSSKFIKDFPGEILNIHPSILPSIKGLNTHERAIRRNLHVHGATVHKVTEKLDSGFILGQTTISIHKNDTPHSLSKRLKPKENQLYVDTLRQFLSGNSKVIQKLELDS